MQGICRKYADDDNMQITCIICSHNADCMQIKFYANYLQIICRLYADCMQLRIQITCRLYAHYMQIKCRNCSEKCCGIYEIYADYLQTICRIYTCKWSSDYTQTISWCSIGSLFPEYMKNSLLICKLYADSYCTDCQIICILHWQMICKTCY